MIRNSRMKMYTTGLGILFLLLVIFIPSSQAQYNVTLATRSFYYSGAAYCSYQSIDTWNCGKACNYNSDLQNVSRIQVLNKTFFGYVGY